MHYPTKNRSDNVDVLHVIQMLLIGCIEIVSAPIERPTGRFTAPVRYLSRFCQKTPTKVNTLTIKLHSKFIIYCTCVIWPARNLRVYFGYK